MNGCAAPRDGDEPRLTVTKVSYWQPVAVDADGTPLHHGERMTEVEPGVWADPLFVAIMDFLEQAGGVA